MGWWGNGIMDGDTPLDYESELFNIAGIDYENERREEKLAEALKKADLLPKVVARINEETDEDYRRVFWHVVALHIMRAGADLSAIKGDVLAVIDNELAGDMSNWNDGGEGRKFALLMFKQAIEKYDNTTPTDPVDERGLFRTIAERLAEPPDDMLVFYPTQAGATKATIINYINSQRNERAKGWEDVGEPDIAKLSDSLAQQWVDCGYNILAGGTNEALIVTEELAQKWDDAYRVIAKMIQKD